MNWTLTVGETVLVV